MTFLERLDYAKKLWAIVLPTTPLPPQPTLVGWLAVYADPEFEAVIVRMPYRLTQNPERVLTNDEVCRIISSQLKESRMKEATKTERRRFFDGRNQ
jgi:hypothetical protein